MTPQQRDRIVALRQQGLAYKEIVALTGLSYSTVYGILHRAGLVIPQKARAHKAQGALDSITPDVLAMHATGSTYLEIATALGVSPNKINKILRAHGKTRSSKYNDFTLSDEDPTDR